MGQGRVLEYLLDPQDLVGGALDAEPNPALRICVNRAASDLILDL